MHTSDTKGASTNAQVILVLYGHDGKSVNIKLERDSDALQQGHSDQFKVDIKDVGIPYKLRVSLSSKHLSHSWHLDRVGEKRRTFILLFYLMKLIDRNGKP